MKKLWNSFWGLIPFGVFLISAALVVCIQVTTENTLRTLPREILLCFGLLSFGVLLIWANSKLRTLLVKLKRKEIFVRTALKGIHFLSAVGYIALSAVLLFFMIFAHTPEHVVTRNGTQMVARVNSFLDENVDYYQYKNPIFYGKKLGREWYGNGSGDPLAGDGKQNPKTWVFYDSEGNLIESGER